jgi:hypothetical protein
VAGAFEVYVWYEADPAAEALVRAAFDRLAARVHDSRAPRLLRRPDLVQREGRERHTWMEVWPGVPALTLDPWLARLADAAGPPSAGVGPRHVEVFGPVVG